MITELRSQKKKLQTIVHQLQERLSLFESPKPSNNILGPSSSFSPTPPSPFLQPLKSKYNKFSFIVTTRLGTPPTTNNVPAERTQERNYSQLYNAIYEKESSSMYPVLSTKVGIHDNLYYFNLI